MKSNRINWRIFLLRYWIPCLAFVALVVCSFDTNFDDSRHIAELFSGSINKIYIAVTVFTLLGLAIRRRKMSTIFWVLELTISCLIITNVLKLSLPLGRPPRLDDGVIIPGYSPGFPSAHTAFAFGLAWLVFVLKPRYSTLWFAVAVAIGWSRIEIRAHYPYQVICGAILGMLLAHFISSSLKGVSQDSFGYFKKLRRSRDLDSNEESIHSSNDSTLTCLAIGAPTAIALMTLPIFSA